MMDTAIVLFTRDLRLADNPALTAAVSAARHVVPLFVHDPAIAAGPVRGAFLAGCLADLRAGLRARGAGLVERRGDPVTEVLRLAGELRAGHGTGGGSGAGGAGRGSGAGTIGVSCAADVSAFAQARQRRLAAACAAAGLHLRLFDQLTVVPPGELVPAGGDSYKIFTPYWRRWQAVVRPGTTQAPDRVTLPPGVRPTDGPEGSGGERAAHARLAAWRDSWESYADGHDDLAGDRTSRLSAHLHFGTLSPRALLDGPEAFVRQVCWRDFYHQVLHAFPRLTARPFKNVVEDWVDDPESYAAWCAGMTGVPLVDAGMRQLAAEGFMHNRARMVVASFLTKHLRIDWRLGAAHFMAHLADADVANNYGNWQWTAGTGNDTRPYRRFNPVRQGYQHDPRGDYVRRHVPELADLAGPVVHEPWKLPRSRTKGYPRPIIEL
ncbi:deoxyribodipyrimidine photo-lyase [Longispora fulva]|uniref:Deoxyribodipyrimidine photo-lyase n=1 Tax=Longispora fulva TaxID=619741 RepID=A0A8J7GFC3_9ACTN|nr:deoxyribodipyrimidine photo-lyase [Longispora fulva]MBG6137784.1 deoxyribodipyrimidine photo-lyase [Longispora fulva]GIG62058.1 deoxyribodipyrimidine photo-lyase [Longispora fulva]